MRNTRKVFAVKGNKRQVVRNGSCSDEEIRLVNELSFASKIATKGGKAFGNGATNANHSCRLQKDTPAFFILAPVLPIIDTFIDFGIHACYIFPC